MGRLREQFLFDEFHVSVNIEHIWLVLRRSDAYLELWSAGIRRVKKNKTNPKSPTKDSLGELCLLQRSHEE